MMRVTHQAAPASARRAGSAAGTSSITSSSAAAAAAIAPAAAAAITSSSAAAAAAIAPAAAAATAAPAGRPSRHHHHHHHRRPLPHPPRITNARREVFADEEEDPVTSSTLPLPRDYAVHDPARGPLTAAGRVTRTLADELASEAVSLEETAYWFSEPPLQRSGKAADGADNDGEDEEGGQSGWWRRGFSGPAGAAATERAPELEGRFPQPRHAADEDEDGEEEEDGGEPIARRPLSDLREGEEVFGFVSDCWLYHGAQVDFLGEYDGLIPISPDAWPQLQRRRFPAGAAAAAASASSSSSSSSSSEPPEAGLFPGLAVRARVHAVRREGLYRWPVQLELLEPEGLAGLVFPSAGEWDPPVDLSWARKQGWDFARIARETGRPEYVPATVAMEPDMTEASRRAQKAFGRDDPQSAAWPAGDSPWHRALAQLGGYEGAEQAAAVGAAQQQARK